MKIRRYGLMKFSNKKDGEEGGFATLAHTRATMLHCHHISRLNLTAVISSPCASLSLLSSKTTTRTPWTSLLLVLHAQLVKKFVTFYGTKRFITVFTTARNETLY
jgi:hypothetical protein